MVASTVSRASYGVRFWTNFDASIHLEKDKIWDIHKGIWRAANQMRWYLKRVRIASQSYLISHFLIIFFFWSLWHIFNKTNS